MDKWVKRYLQEAYRIGQWSKDPSTQVGAVIFDPVLHTRLGDGYNGPPHGFDDSFYLENRDLKLAATIHAEMNAVLHSAQAKAPVHMVVTKFPCDRCAAFISACKYHPTLPTIQKIYAVFDSTGTYEQRWLQNIHHSSLILKSAGIEIETVDAVIP